MLWLAQLSAPAANANLFAIYLGEFWPRANEPWPRFLILTILVGTLTLINVRGVRTGTSVNNAFTIAKLVPLGIVIAAGLIYMMLGHGALPSPAVSHPTGAWLTTILLLVYAYGGFETAITPMSEAKNPQRDAAFGLIVALVACTLIYWLIQWITVVLLPNAGTSDRPIADVARLVLGEKGAFIVSVGVLVSLYGYLSAKILAVPRVTYALAEGGDFPGIFAAVHSRFRTPYFSILVFGVLIWLLAALGSFRWNLTLSAVARLTYYGVGCAALPVLRRKQPKTAVFHLPGGLIFSILGVAICLVLLTQVDLSKSLILVATVLVAFLNWLWVRRRPRVQ
jgi:APA family basic amino acid/polyamine antiporter